MEFSITIVAAFFAGLVGGMISRKPHDKCATYDDSAIKTAINALASNQGYAISFLNMGTMVLKIKLTDTERKLNALFKHFGLRLEEYPAGERIIKAGVKMPSI